MSELCLVVVAACHCCIIIWWTRAVMYAKLHYYPPKEDAFAPPLPPQNPPLFQWPEGKMICSTKKGIPYHCWTVFMVSVRRQWVCYMYQRCYCQQVHKIRDNPGLEQATQFTMEIRCSLSDLLVADFELYRKQHGILPRFVVGVITVQNMTLYNVLVM